MQGSALLEFAITLPLLVVFVVGIYDFSGAFNQKQKIEQAAQEGAIIAGAQPMSDIQSSSTSPPGPSSLLPVVTAVFNSLASSGVLPNGTACTPPGTVSGPGTGPAGLTWTYTISGCSSAYPSDHAGHHHQPRMCMWTMRGSVSIRAPCGRRHHRYGYISLSLAIQ